MQDKVYVRFHMEVSFNVISSIEAALQLLATVVNFVIAEAHKTAELYCAFDL